MNYLYLAKRLPKHAFVVLSTTFFLAILVVTATVSRVGDKSSIRNNVDKMLVSRDLQANCESFDTSKVYHIIASHSGMALRIENDSTDNGSRVVQQPLSSSSSSSVTADGWMLQTTSSSGYYSVINVNSNKALDIFHASTALGADAIQYDVVPGSLNQQFCFDNIGNGYFQLIARHSGQALDIYHGLTVAGTKVVQYTKSASSINQQFQIVEVGTAIPPPPCATFDTTKSYHLVAVHSNKALAIRGASAEPGTRVVQMTTSTTGTEALWSFVPVGTSGHYHVINGNSLLAMNVAGNRPDDGQAIIQWTASASATNDNWCFQDAGGGAYHIVSERSGDAVDVASNSPNDDGITVQWPISGDDNQKFRVMEALGCATFDSTKHYVIMARHSNMAVSVINNTPAGVAQATLDLMIPSLPSHMWALQPIEGGYYHIVNEQSGSGLNIGYNSREPGARLIQWPLEDGEENDDFCFQDLNNGYFTIVARHSGLALDVARADTSDGATLVQYTRTNAYNQQFRVEEVIISTFQPSLSLVPSDMESSFPSASVSPSDTPPNLPSAPPSTTSAPSLPKDNGNGAPTMSATPSESIHPSESMTPSVADSSSPSISAVPSVMDSVSPSVSNSPSIEGSLSPSVSSNPSETPSVATTMPSVSAGPSVADSSSPSISAVPSVMDSVSPSVSNSPSIEGSLSPSVSSNPSGAPSFATTMPSVSVGPSVADSSSPSISAIPSVMDSVSPSMSVGPSVEGSVSPSVSSNPSGAPSVATTMPSVSAGPSVAESSSPSISAVPSVMDSVSPSMSVGPSVEGSVSPSVSSNPSGAPSVATTMPSVSVGPSVADSSSPSISAIPSVMDSVSPSVATLVCTMVDAITNAAVPFMITAQHSGKALYTRTETNLDIIQLPADNNIEAENNHWEFRPSETDGYYHIQNSLADTPLNLQDTMETLSTQSGAGIIHGPDYRFGEGGDEEQISDNFCLVDQGGGFYAIFSELSGLALSVEGGSYNDGALLVQLPFVGLPSQKFKLTLIMGEPVPMPIGFVSSSLSMAPSFAPSLSSLPSRSQEPSQSAAPSTMIGGCVTMSSDFAYHITSRHSAKAIYGDPNSIFVYQSPVSTTYLFDNWVLEQSDSGGHYHIVNIESGLALNVNGASTAVNQRIIQSDPSNFAISDNWCFVDAGEGFHYIRSQVSGLVLSVRSGSFADGAPYAQLPYERADGQLFLLTGTQTEAPPPIAPSPITSIAPVVAPVVPLPPLAECMAMDTTLTYHIISRRTGKAMYTDGGSLSENVGVFELPVGVSTADNWILEKTGAENHYHIVNAHSGFAMISDDNEYIVLQQKSGDMLDDWCFEATEMGYLRISSVGRPNEVLMVNTDYEGETYPLTLYYEDMGWHAQQFRLFPVNENHNTTKGIWEGPFTLGIIPASMANLPNGNILAWAAVTGNDLGGEGDGTATAIWDPVTRVSVKEEQVTITNHDMFCPGTSVLPDSRVMITGGHDAGIVTIYDPRSDTWSNGPELQVPRGYHGQTLTSDGSVFTVGGSYSGGTEADKIGELWNVTTGVWEVKSGISAVPFETNDVEGVYRADNHVWLFEAPNGYIFHAGPSKQMHWIDLEGDGTVIPSITRGDDLDSMEGGTVMFDVGMILKTGGAENYDLGRASNRSYVINITDPHGTLEVSVERTGDMIFERTFHTPVVLPNGQVVIAGGTAEAAIFTDTSAVLMAEIWDPTTGEYSPLATMSIPRTYHSSAVLGKDGRVIMGGGGMCVCPADHPDIEILTPPYLLNDDDTPKVRPVIQNAPATVEYGEEFTVRVDNSLYPDHKFAMVRTGAATHATNNDVRRVPCDIISTDGMGSYNLTFPDSPSVTLPGVWFLFAMSLEGTPSIASSIMIHPL